MKISTRKFMQRLFEETRRQLLGSSPSDSVNPAPKRRSFMLHEVIRTADHYPTILAAKLLVRRYIFRRCSLKTLGHATNTIDFVFLNADFRQNWQGFITGKISDTSFYRIMRHFEFLLE